MCLYPVPNILLPHDIEAQIQQRSAKKPQLDLSKIESQEKDLNGNGSTARLMLDLIFCLQLSSEV